MYGGGGKGWAGTSIGIFPFFFGSCYDGRINWSGEFPSVTFTLRGRINVDLLYDIQKVEVKLEMKEQ